MPGLPKAALSALNKARESAMLAVEVYNKPAVSFRTGGYVSLIVIAWTALFHAVFFRRHIKPYYRKPGSRQFLRVDGDYKHWEIAECVKQYWGGENPPERQNLEFIARLRNQVEHRTIPEIDAEVYGECQACLLNFEDCLVKMFGEKCSIRCYLSFPLQISRKPPERPLKTTGGWARVKQFIQDFRGSLSTDVYTDNRFSFQVYLVPKIGNRPTTDSVAVEFVKYDPTKPEEMAKYEHVTALIKEKRVPVRNLGGFRPSGVVMEIKRGGFEQFIMASHTWAWHHYKVRPPKDTANPESCRTEYCTYDVLNKNYVYTREWVDFLIAELRHPKKRAAIIAADPP